MTRSTFIRTSLRLVVTAVAAITLSIMTSVSAAAQDTAKSKAAKPGLDIMLMKPSPTGVKAGDNQFEVTLKGTDGKPVENADVSIVFVMPPMGAMAEMRNEVKLKSAGSGKYIGSGNVMMAGKWNVTISVKQNGKEIGQKKVAVTAK